MRKLFYILTACIAMGYCGMGYAASAKKTQLEDSAVKLEAKVPKDHETSPYMLNLLLLEVSDDMDEIPNEGTVISLKKKYEIKKHKFSNLIPRVKTDGFFQVSLKDDERGNLPLDMAGLGPFYLTKKDGDYYLITPKNYATLFGGIRNTEEALNYLAAYENLFVSPVVCVATSGNEKALKKAKRTPPRLSSAIQTAQGFEATLIIYSIIQVEGFFEKKVLLTPEGAVTVIEEPKLIQKIGDGITY